MQRLYARREFGTTSYSSLEENNEEQWRLMSSPHVADPADYSIWQRTHALARIAVGAQRRREDLSRWERLLGFQYRYDEADDETRTRMCDEILRRDPHAQALIAAKKDEA